MPEEPASAAGEPSAVDADGFWLGHGGHQWNSQRRVCGRCGMGYRWWTGDQCPEAPRCRALHGAVGCNREVGHDGEHYVVIAWSDPYDPDAECAEQGHVMPAPGQEKYFETWGIALPPRRRYVCCARCGKPLTERDVLA